MKRLLPLAGIASLLLTGCGSQNAASLFGASVENPSGFTGVETMSACAMASGDCFPLEIESDGKSVLRIHYPTDVWVDAVDSGCSSGYCWAVDANGAEWKMEP